MPADDRVLDWLVLVRAPGLGPVAIRRLVTRHGSAAAIRQAAADHPDLPAPIRRHLVRTDHAAAERDLAWAARAGNAILCWADRRYPPLLREIPDPPSVLYVRGDIDVLGTPQIALVGSRNPTPAGRQTATAFARDLARQGCTVTSGLALGIDAAAHRGALAGPGPTVAVLGSGPDRLYPSRNRCLGEELLAAGGAVVSELPPGSAPRPENFPRRNRIISALSLGCLVVEAALRSGSLITARHAAEQGREVFAVPGSIHNPLARGCHALIREGAKLVETVDDVLEELGALAAVLEEAVQAREALPDDERNLLQYMGFAPIGVDQLAAESGLTAERVCSMLLTLELRGHVASSPGGLFCRVEERGADERKRP